MAFSPEYAARLAAQPALPQISDCTHAHTLYDGGGLAMGSVTSTHTSAVNSDWFNQGLGNQGGLANALANAQANTAGTQNQTRGLIFPKPAQQQKEIEQVADPKRRLVKVIIIDPDEKVPLEKCVLYSGSEKLTDLTDQELFFEIEIKDILHDHNEVRKKVIDKSVKERTEFLEPLKVRDLRMVVVTVAQF